MLWEVRGTDRQNGQKRVEHIHAHSEKQARAIANSEGVSVSSCISIDTPPGAVATRPQTIEATGKGWKFQMLLAMALTVWGIVWIVQNAGEGGKDERLALGVLIVACGLVWLVFAKIGAWWSHG